MNKLNLSIGILSWKRNDVLRQTLLSYKKNGLLETSNDITVFFNEMGDEEVSLAKEFGLKHIGSTENIGIKNGYKALADNAKTNIFCFWKTIGIYSRIEKPHKNDLKVELRFFPRIKRKLYATVRGNSRASPAELFGKMRSIRN